MFFLLSKTLDVLLSPFSWSIALIAIGLFSKGTPVRRRWFGGAGLAVLGLFSLEPVGNFLLRSLERGAVQTYRADADYDALILLGGMVERSSVAGRPAYNENVERLLVTYDLLRSNRAHYALVSGGALDPTVPDLVEAKVLAQQLLDWGISSERVIVEPRSRNTHENAVECRRIAGERGLSHLLLITSAFHLPRALGCFRAVGLQVDTLPVDYRSYDPSRFSGSLLPRANHLERSEMALREWFGRGIYWVRGYSR